MKKTLLFGSALLLAVTAAVAQTPEGPRPPHGPGGPPEMRGHGGPGEFMGGIDGHTVTGSPFSAQIVSTSTQTLQDGSHINRNVNATVARDNSGRTYRQQTMDNLGPVPNGASKTMVFIHDPVAHTSHVLSVENKTDMMANMPQHPRGPRGNGPNSAANPPANAPQAEARTRPQRKGETVESLGSQMMEGVMADGTRITHTIPAGTIGNEHEIKVVSETWYSKDLQTVVMSKHIDPRMGESVFKLTNIQRTEPDATLFQVPAGFKVTEQRHGR
jgi:hypothetical protein